MGEIDHKLHERDSSGRNPFPSPGKSADSPIPVRLPELRLLVVDDDFVSRLALERILLTMGHRAEGVEHGEQALRALARDSYDGVLMDVRMVVMDGLEATRRIRAGEAGEANRDLPIIAVTAHSLAGDKERILDQGLNAYLSKPFFVEDLVSIMRKTFLKAS